MDAEQREKYIEDYKKKYTQGRSPYERANFIQKWLFTWIAPMIKVSKHVVFDQGYHYPLREADESGKNFEKLKKHWADYTRSKDRKSMQMSAKPTLISSVRAFKWELIWCCFLSVIITVLDYGTTFCIYTTLGRLKDNGTESALSSKSMRDILLFLVIGVSSTSIFSIIVNCQQSYLINSIGVRIGNSLKCLIFDKVLKKSIERESMFSLGEITNLSQVDAATYDDIADYASLMVSAPLEILAGMLGLYFLMGFALVPAIGVVLLSFLVNWLISKVYKKSKKSLMGRKDSRARTVCQLFENIKFVKLNGLENFYILEAL